MWNSCAPFRIALFGILFQGCELSCVGSCHDSNIAAVARVVFGEARGEIYMGQLAVAYTIVNRVAHTGYRNTITEVLGATYVGGDGNTHHEYKTLDDQTHDAAWADATKYHTTEYTDAIKAAKDALCKCASDPTTCGTDFCEYEQCSAFNNNQCFTSTNKTQIGNNWFACREAVLG